MDAQTGELVYYLTDIAWIPGSIAIIAGDILFNLRSALDHLAYQLVLSSGATPDKDTYFPIFKDATAYASGKAGKDVA